MWRKITSFIENLKLCFIWDNSILHLLGSPLTEFPKNKIQKDDFDFTKVLLINSYGFINKIINILMSVGQNNYLCIFFVQKKLLYRFAFNSIDYTRHFFGNGTTLD